MISSETIKYYVDFPARNAVDSHLGMKRGATTSYLKTLDTHLAQLYPDASDKDGAFERSMAKLFAIELTGYAGNYVSYLAGLLPPSITAAQCRLRKDVTIGSYAHSLLEIPGVTLSRIYNLNPAHEFRYIEVAMRKQSCAKFREALILNAQHFILSDPAKDKFLEQLGDFRTSVGAILRYHE